MPPPSLTNDPIPSLSLRIALPASTGMLFNTMFNFADTYCAGLLSTDALASLSLSFPVFFLFLALGSGISQATTALMASAVGSDDPQLATRLFSQSLLCTLAIGAVASALGLLLTPTLFTLLGATDEYLRTALSYTNVLLSGGVIFLLTLTLNSALAAQGETRTYRNFLIVSCLANLLLNPILMWGWLGTPPLGVSGIALATVIVQTLGAAWLYRKVFASKLFLNRSKPDLRPNPRLIRQILQQAIPSALNMLTVALGVFVISWFAKHFGKEAVAAAGIAMRIEQIVLMPAIGLGTAVLTLTGQNHGAGKPERIRHVWRFNSALGAGLMILGGSLVLWLREPAMRLLSNDSTVVEHGVRYLGYSSLTLATYPILFVTVFLMQGLKRPAYGFLMGLYRQIIAPAVVFPLLAFSLNGGIDGVWLGILLVNWSAALFALWWGNRVVRQLLPVSTPTLHQTG